MYIVGEGLDSYDDIYYGYYDDKSVYIKWIGIVIAICINHVGLPHGRWVCLMG